MNHFQLARFGWILVLLFGCSGRHAVDEVLTSDALPVKLPELAQEPLEPATAMTAEYFRQSYPHLSTEAFQQKWQNSQKSGLLFLRSFVNTWYDEVGRLSLQGPIGPCFGDPHPENFGYLVFAGSFEYTYNDSDDSGACPVLFDALRYFTSLKIMLQDSALEADLRRAYLGFLDGEPLTDRPSRRLRPDPEETEARLLKKITAQGKIREEPSRSSLSSIKAEALFALLQKSDRTCASCRKLDAVQVQVKQGGSAGLDRYWILVQSGPHTQELIEFKELTEPASHRGPWAQKRRLSRQEILASIWGTQWPEHFAFVSFEGDPFLMRSRLNAEPSLDELKPEQKKALLTEQVYLLAQLHRKTLRGGSRLGAWLEKQSSFQAQRYGEALRRAKGG